MAMSRADTFSSTQHPHLRVYLEPNKPLNECVDSRDGIALLMHFSCLCVLCFFLLHACNFASVIVISRKHTLAHKWIQFFVCVCVCCARSIFDTCQNAFASLHNTYWWMLKWANERSHIEPLPNVRNWLSSHCVPRVLRYKDAQCNIEMEFSLMHWHTLYALSSISGRPWLSTDSITN